MSKELSLDKEGPGCGDHLAVRDTVLAAARLRRIHCHAEPAWLEETVSVELFRGYAAWLAANAHGYVLNIERSMNPSDAHMHEADCRTITGTPSRGGTWTGSYVKACSISLTELDAWALSHLEQPSLDVASASPDLKWLHPHPRRSISSIRRLSSGSIYKRCGMRRTSILGWLGTGCKQR